MICINYTSSKKKPLIYSINVFIQTENSDGSDDEEDEEETISPVTALYQKVASP